MHLKLGQMYGTDVDEMADLEAFTDSSGWPYIYSQLYGSESLSSRL